jgi:hypothetical protein
MLLSDLHLSRARNNMILSELIILPGVTQLHLVVTHLIKRSKWLAFYVKGSQDSFTMHYNELKELILRALAQDAKDSLRLNLQLSSECGGRFEIHALRMALVRYYKQGLLNRERRGGTFTYSISERGRRRLEWLESLRQQKSS